MGELLRQTVDQKYGRGTSTTQIGDDAVRTVEKAPDVTSRVLRTTRATTKNPQVATKTGTTQRTTNKDAFARRTTTTSSGGTLRSGTTTTSQEKDRTVATTEEGPESSRTRVTNRSGITGRDSVEFTFKIQIQNRNPVDPATLA